MPTLLHITFEGADGSTTFTDTSPSAHTVTANGNVQIDTSQSAVGTSSGLFDGNGDWLSIPDSDDFNISSLTSTFNLDFYVRFNNMPPTSPGVVQFFAQYNTVNDFQMFYMSVSGATFGGNRHLCYSCTDGTVDVNFFADVNSVVTSTGQWYKITYSKTSAGLFKMYVDDVLVSNANYGSTIFGDISGDVTIGRNTDPGINAGYLDGWMDELIFSRDGVDGRPINFYSSASSSYVDDFNFGSGDFTAESWLRFNALDGSANNRYGLFGLSALNTVGVDNSWDFHLFDNFLVDNWTYEFNYSVNGSTVTSPGLWPCSISTGTWIHVALVRYGTYLLCFQDGSMLNSGAQYPGAGSPQLSIGTVSLNMTTRNLYLGAVDSANDQVFHSLDGWMDEVRISNVARYTTNFTPQVTPFVVDSYTVLLLHNEGTDGSQVFVDSSLRHDIQTNGNVQIDTAQAQVGSASGLFSAGSDWLKIPYSPLAGQPVNFYSRPDSINGPSQSPSEDFDIENEPFAIDCWVYFSSFNTSQIQCIACCEAGSSPILGSDYGWEFNYVEAIGDSTQYSLRFNYGYPGPSIGVATYNFTLSTGTWYHVAVTCDTTNLYIFLDGILGSTTTVQSNVGRGIKEKFYVGTLNRFPSFAAHPHSINGYIDQFRFSEGTVRWTSNFTPQTTLYTPDIYTALLLNFESSLEDTMQRHSTSTLNGAVLSSVQAVIGTYSMYLPVSGSNFSVDGSGLYVVAGGTAVPSVSKPVNFYSVP